MKNAETKDRIKKALEVREMKQSELVGKTGIDKGQMSSYLAGRYKPKQENLSLIAEALSVDEAWLMGYDVPMERNNYEDQTILRFDAEFDDARDIIESAGYLTSLSDDSNDIIIKNANNEIIACMHDYELVGKYESLQCKDISPTAKLLLEDKETQYIIDKVYAFDCQLKSLGWIYKIMIEPSPSDKEHGMAVAIFKNKDISFRASMEDCDSFINDGETFFKERLQQLLKKSMKQMFVDNSIDSKSYLEPQAAHERTDIEVTDEMRKHDDDIMDDDNFWK